MVRVKALREVLSWHVLKFVNRARKCCGSYLSAGACTCQKPSACLITRFGFVLSRVKEIVFWCNRDDRKDRLVSALWAGSSINDAVAQGQNGSSSIHDEGCKDFRTSSGIIVCTTLTFKQNFDKEKVACGAKRQQIALSSGDCVTYLASYAIAVCYVFSFICNCSVVEKVWDDHNR